MNCTPGFGQSGMPLMVLFSEQKHGVHVETMICMYIQINNMPGAPAEVRWLAHTLRSLVETPGQWTPPAHRSTGSARPPSHRIHLHTSSTVKCNAGMTDKSLDLHPSKLGMPATETRTKYGDSAGLRDRSLGLHAR